MRRDDNKTAYAFLALNKTPCPSTQLRIISLRRRSESFVSDADWSANELGLQALESVLYVPALMEREQLALKRAQITVLGITRDKIAFDFKEAGSEAQRKIDETLGEVNFKEVRDQLSKELHERFGEPYKLIDLPDLAENQAFRTVLYPPVMPENAVVAYRIEHWTKPKDGNPQFIGELHAVFAPLFRPFD